ncbi:MAG: hypothetical protein HY429_01140 [Candidatus Levybacteria bacterium]|nr:hypothetical protein [Candidatus Levybacteria bacterium]
MSERLRQATIGKIKKGPAVIRSLREKVAQEHFARDFTLGTVVDVLNKHHYILSRQQSELLGEPFNAFIAHNRAATYARSLYKQDQGTFYRIVASAIGCSEENVAGIEIHPTSISIKVDSATFSTLWREDVTIQDKQVPAVGFTNEMFVLDLHGHSLPYAIVDAKKARSSTPDHENLHIQYGYLHPRFLRPAHVANKKQRQEDRKDHGLLKEAQAAVSDNNETAFTALVQGVTYSYLHDFLTELAASAIEGEGVFDQFWGNGKHYYDHFAKYLSILEQAIPSDVFAGLPFRYSIFFERAIVKQKMRYIEDRFEELKKAGVDPFDIVTVVEFLTPERGYLINAFIPPGEFTVADIRAWRKAYNEALPKGDVEKESYDWQDFIFAVAQIDSQNYNPARDKVREMLQYEEGKGYTPITLPDVKQNPEQFFADVEDVIRRLKEATIQRAARLNQVLDIDFIQNSMAKLKAPQIIRQRIITDSIDFHTRFKDLLFEFAVDWAGEHQHERCNAAAYLVSRALQLDDAAEETARLLTEGETPDFDTLFAPGFQKSDKRYEKMMQWVENPLNRPDEISFAEAKQFVIYAGEFRGGYIYLERGGVYSYTEYQKKAMSFILRLLIWAKRVGYKGEGVGILRSALKGKSFDLRHRIQRPYKTMIEDLLAADEG